MAYLGTQALVLIHQEPRLGKWLYNTGLITANNANYNGFDVNIPNDMALAWCTKIRVWTESHQTLPGLADDEMAMLHLNRGADQIASGIPSKRVVTVGNDTAGTVPIHNLYEWDEPFSVILRADDNIQFFMPPADDGGTPVGDYRVVAFELARIER